MEARVDNVTEGLLSWNKILYNYPMNKIFSQDAGDNSVCFIAQGQQRGANYSK